MVITDQAQFEQLVQEVRDQILSESQGVGEVDIVDNLDSIYSLPALKLNDNGDQVVEAPLSLLSAPAEEAAALAKAAAYDANTAAESANSAASSANLATDKANEATSNAQSATQQAESSADKANTAAQNADEATAQVLSGESERVEAENARQAAETERQSAEEERKSAEEARKLAEQSREEAETSRVSAEESRVTAESERVTAESNRVQAETERVQKESERESAESTRQQNETTRQSNEDTRNQQEQTRQTNEEQRISAESSRETEYTNLKQSVDALIDDNEAAIENANTAAENANAAIANMENTYAKKDEIPDVSEFITISVDNLVNYYRKSETYNQEQINSLIGSITTINFKIVDSLPGTGENNLIYLVPSNKQEENNVKDEYIWVDGSWELIGSTKIDLSNYYTKDEVNSTFALKTELAWDTITGKPVWIGLSKPTYTWSEINEKPTTISGYGITDAYTKTESDEKYVTLSTEQTITGSKTFTGNLKIYRRSIYITNNPEHNATGLFWINASDNTTLIGGTGMYSADGITPQSFFIGWGTTPWATANNFQVNSDFIRYKGQNILHTGNYETTTDTRYVNKGGDTMTGEFINTNNIKVICKNHGVRLTGDSNYGYLQLGNITSTAEEQRGIIEGHSGAYLDSLDIRVKSSVLSNAVTINNNVVWHAGNDGSGSGLDADLLDGLDWNNFSIKRNYTIDLSGYSTSNFYPVFFIAEYKELDCEIQSPSLSGSADYNCNRIHFLYASVGWSDYGNTLRILSRHNYSDTKITIGSIGRGTQLGGIAVWLRGGMSYTFRSNRVPNLKTSDYTYGAEIYTVGTNLYGGTNTNVNTVWTNNSNRDKNVLAMLDSNVASATKLQTPRTIWGQSFDGTANVSGAMTGVGSISFSSSVACDLDTYGNVIFKSTNDANTWNVLNPDKTSFISVRAVSGNVGIGVPTSNYKLHVNGTFYASGAATLGSTLTVNGDLTVKGTIIDSTSSDIRLKSILERVDYQEKLLSLGDVVDFDYNDTAFSRENSSNLEHRSYTGLIYQNVKEILPQMAHEDDDGYGYLNYLSHDYINLIAGALQQTITKQKQLEKRISILEEENINLKQQLSN